MHNRARQACRSYRSSCWDWGLFKKWRDLAMLTCLRKSFLYKDPCKKAVSAKAGICKPESARTGQPRSMCLSANRIPCPGPISSCCRSLPVSQLGHRPALCRSSATPDARLQHGPVPLPDILKVATEAAQAGAKVGSISL